jgi:hypothetical protein
MRTSLPEVRETLRRTRREPGPAAAELRELRAQDAQATVLTLDVGDEHARAAGRLCRDGGDGCCEACGVSLVECPDCHGRGYHEDTCTTELDEPFDARFPTEVVR